MGDGTGPVAVADSGPAAGRLPTGANVVLVFSALVLFSSYVATAVTHLNDTAHLDFVSGVWMALAQYTNAGTVYPEVYDGSFYGGTRYMPLPFLAHAGLARVTGEYLLSGKLLALMLAVGCCALVYRALRRAGCTVPVALALTSLLPADKVCYLAGTNVRGDLLAVVLQLAALAVATRARRSRGAVVAGLLCALAVLGKVTSLWAPAAICLCSFRRDRRFCVLFLGTWLAGLALALGALHLATGGRMLANFRALAGSTGETLRLLPKAPFRLLLFVAVDSPLLTLLMPFLVVEAVRAVRGRRLTAYHWAAFLCLPLLLVIYTDRGTTANHLIDLTALAVILVGFLWRSLGDWQGLTAGMQAPLLAAVVWGGWSLWAAGMGHEARDLFAPEAWSALRAGPHKPLAGLVGDDELFLTEDAYLAVARRQRPVVLDPYALVILEKKHPEWVADLAARVRRKEFTRIVLNYRLDLDLRVDNDRYRILFGHTVAEAVRAAYRFEREAEGYCLFVPCEE